MRTSIQTTTRAAWLLLLAASAAQAEPAQQIDFAQDVRPILNRHCVKCHGGVKQAAGVSFIYHDQVLGLGDSEESIVVPGDVDASLLIYKITADESERMPPPEEGSEGLSDDEIATLTRWVEQGAPWADHWSFIAPQSHATPAVADPAWPRVELDHFVLARLDTEGIEPSPEAEPDRWLRRVSLDLTGLPPALDERAAFLDAIESQGEAAYAAVVDRLLASSRFGERWATVWLDQVRYADSMGLGQDGRRSIWKYRDWVIDALNNDLPYDDFTVKQLAGDLLPNPSMEDLIATACHRATQSNEEGGTDDEQFRVEAVLDRVNTTWQVWQGLTFGCTQCHHHPYDPLRHEEYYRFAAFFNNTADSDLDSDWPSINAPRNAEDYVRARDLDQQIDELGENIWRAGHELASDADAWRPIQGLSASTTNRTQVVVESRSDHDEYSTQGTVTQGVGVVLEAPLPDGCGPLTAIRFTALPLDPEKAVADSEWGFVLSHIKVELITPESDEPISLDIAQVIADEAHPALDPNLSLNEKNSHGFSAYTRIHHPRSGAFVLQTPIEPSADARLRVTLSYKVFMLGAFPLVARRGHLAVSDDSRFTAWLTDPSIASQREELAQLRKEREAIPSVKTPVMRERPQPFVRPMHVFVRGNALEKDQLVSPGTPGSLPPIDGPVEPDRLALARWIASSENPLTARVMVNRLWSRMFGMGLVATEEDFGSSGESPSHPALLDDLAIRFAGDMEWSVKSLLREIALSSTYRQSGFMRVDLADRDPQNRLLARGPRQRLAAETVRDQALSVAGLLSDKMHGPPVHPPIPDGVWQPFQGGDKWNTPPVGDPDRYRRSIYTYVKRSIPYPMFASFDAPSREFCTSRRMRSNTPLQALMTLNSATFDEAFRALAGRMREASDSPEAQIRFGILAATCREASPAETADLLGLYEAALGATSDAEPHDDERAREQALALVASVLLNLDEVLSN